ncbi:putative bifunctional diguanylate cyclase/phosphodiesterase [Metaplanococcus flavidus]|uniref:Bifunctional diguanylate cyclase/phosphodiesterase n=1 Tax=Metaplanococcus flavidus TaxID=569883 RepID=A0ABW3LEQ1_9BACL
MKTLGRQTQELIEKLPDFVVVLNAAGIIMYSNQSWVDYCCDHQLSNSLWKTGSDCLENLVDDRNRERLKWSKNPDTGAVEDSFQPSSVVFKNFSIRSRQFPLEEGAAGIILYIHPLELLPFQSLTTASILENMTDAFYLLDRKMNFQYVNSNTESLLNVTKEELLGANIWTLFPQWTGTRSYANYNRAMQERVQIEYRDYHGPSDSWFAVRLVPVGEDGLAVYYQRTSNDVVIQQALTEYASTDYLTTWTNRRKFEENLEMLLKQDTPLSLLYINLDNFKHINNLYNHKTGDEVLKVLAKNLEKILKPYELAGRLDGDELVLLHLRKDGEELDDFPQKVKEVFAQAIILENSQVITVNASIGVSLYPQDSSNANELITFAETAMRNAKIQKGTSNSFFHSDMGTDLARRLLIERDLSGNLKAKGFHFVLQPQINCSTGETDGVEVLARWHHPKLGPLSPLEFIGIAEETGTISHLTKHLLNEVFSFLKYNHKLYHGVPRTAINITPSLLTSRLFFEDLFRLMDKYQISSDWIEIEITESEELTVSEVTLENLLACRARGISIALDDFGTGFSMLAYLMDFPIDKIKLDKSFISKIGFNLKSEAVVKSLIQFVKNIGCKLVAEGVESQAEAAFLEMNGCLIHQGYLYDRPLLPETFVKYYLSGDEYENSKSG